MAPKFCHSVSFILLLTSLINNSSCDHTHLPESQQNHPSALDFLEKIIGAGKGNKPINGLNMLKKHLTFLGYLDSSNNTTNEDDDIFNEELELGIKKYQMFFNLETTGILDHKTATQLRLPRCGVPDYSNKNTITASSKYTFLNGEPKWPDNKIKHLTYSFPPGTRKDVMYPIHKAVQEWSSVSCLKFYYTKDYRKADIKISFQSRDHGDGYPFDGPGGTVAHSFPPTDGTLHYDADENWSARVEPGAMDLQSVGLHELGHVLGLGHTADPAAAMFPVIGVGVRKGLGTDDVMGIRALYPRKKKNQ